VIKLTKKLWDNLSLKELPGVEEKKLTNEEVLTMPDRDGTGPRKRSWRPSKKKGGRKLGKC